MKKLRLYELAKELKMESAELQEKLNAEGYDYNNRLCGLVPEAVDKMRTLYGPLPERTPRKPSPEKKKKKKKKERPSERKSGRVQEKKSPPPKAPEPKKEPEKKTPTTARKIADLPASVVKGKDGKISLPSNIAKSVKKKVALPPHERVKKKKGKKSVPEGLEQIGKAGKPGERKVDYSKFDVEDGEKEKKPTVAPDERETKRRKKDVDYFGGKAVRVVMPSRRGKDRGKQHGVIVRRKGKGARGADLPGKRSDQAQQQEFVRPEKIEVTYPISVRDLSAMLGVKANMLIKKLLEHGVMATINDYLGEDAVITLGLEFGTEVVEKKEKTVQSEIKEREETPDKPEELEPRAPVVAFLGHVDHGKTSLLDAIRMTSVQETEHGGITQNFTAWTVKKGDAKIVFLDTPGHEAFTAMRARGAEATDVVVLVVAVDDGVMPQTEEAISHAKAAGVSIIVALNKVDKPNANVMRTKQQLAGLDLNPPEWGGKTEMVETSATQGMGIDDLFETIILESEIMELRYNPGRPATGIVLESEVSEGKGVVARLLVKNGVLKKGDTIAAGAGYGRVRGMINSDSEPIDEAVAPEPVEVSGLDQLPSAGDLFHVVDDIQKARTLAEEAKKEIRETSLASKRKVTLENLFSTIEADAAKEVRLVLKADVMGSIEVIEKAVNDLSTKEVKVKIIHSAVGAINESDIVLADASGAVVLGFMVVPDDKARSTMEELGVDVRLYQVIYNLIDDLKLAMEGMLDPDEKEEVKGHLEVRTTFKASRIGVIAGCYVKDGTINRTDKVRLIREGTIIYTGVIDSLKRFKDDVREVREGFECGLKIKGYDDVKVGDVIEAYEIQKVARKLESTK